MYYFQELFLKVDKVEQVKHCPREYVWNFKQTKLRNVYLPYMSIIIIKCNYC